MTRLGIFPIFLRALLIDILRTFVKLQLVGCFILRQSGRAVILSVEEAVQGFVALRVPLGSYI